VETRKGDRNERERERERILGNRNFEQEKGKREEKDMQGILLAAVAKFSASSTRG